MVVAAAASIATEFGVMHHQKLPEMAEFSLKKYSKKCSSDYRHQGIYV